MIFVYLAVGQIGALHIVFVGLEIGFQFGTRDGLN